MSQLTEYRSVHWDSKLTRFAWEKRITDHSMKCFVYIFTDPNVLIIGFQVSRHISRVIAVND